MLSHATVKISHRNSTQTFAKRRLVRKYLSLARHEISSNSSADNTQRHPPPPPPNFPNPSIS